MRYTAQNVVFKILSFTIAQESTVFIFSCNEDALQDSKIFIKLAVSIFACGSSVVASHDVVFYKCLVYGGIGKRHNNC